MRVVVVGVTGNIGSALARVLAASGDTEVVGLARRPPGPGSTLPDDALEFRAADVSRDDLAPHFRGADAVVLLSWLFQPTHRPEITWDVNVGGTTRALRAVAEAGVPTVVYSSSVGAYSPARPLGSSEPVDESWPTDSLPTAAYGREKAYVERVLDGFSAERRDVRVIRFRPGFVFQPTSGTQQRRLFAGPLVPRRLVRPGRLPVLPWVRGLRFQAVHAEDVAGAMRNSLVSDVTGAFNLAAQPVVDEHVMAELMQARPVVLPPSVVRGAVATAWHGRMVPSDPALLDLVLSLPVMSSERARRLLDWSPRFSAVDALCQGLTGLADGAGDATAPLAPDSAAGRLAELRSGVGERV